MTALLDLPTPQIADEAQKALREFRRADATSDAHVRLMESGTEGGEVVTVPRAAFDLFLEVLGQMQALLEERSRWPHTSPEDPQ